MYYVPEEVTYHVSVSVIGMHMIYVWCCISIEKWVILSPSALF